MPSEKAKENKTLTVECRACGKLKSTEVVQGRLVLSRGKRQTVPVCDECRAAGKQPVDQVEQAQPQ